jgi:hypothetical protein
MRERVRRALTLDAAERERLLEAARAVLDANWRGTATVPSRSLYPHQWSWDSAFHAIGRAWYDQARAQQELETLFGGQWANGMLPHILFDSAMPDRAYFPGPDFWQSERASPSASGVRTSGITQPPVHARAALEVHRQAEDPMEALAFLHRLYPKLVALHRYLAGGRDPEGHGLAAIVHPWESGMDNSPAWDGELAELVVPPGSLPPYHRYDLEHAEAADRPSDAAYDRFVYLAIIYRDLGYDDTRLLQGSPFLVETPLFNAIWLWSCRALAEIARLVGDDPAPHRAMADRIHEGMLARLWDPESRRFGTRDVRDGRRGPENTIMSFMPLLDDELPRPVVEALAAGLDSPSFRPPDAPSHFLVPSYDLRDPAFDPRGYWRGPVWVNTDWLLWWGLRRHDLPDLADEIAASVVGLVQRSGFREYYDPFSGAGHGSDEFGWTAALLIDLLHRQRG